MTQPQLELQALADELGLSQQVSNALVHLRLCHLFIRGMARLIAVGAWPVVSSSCMQKPGCNPAGLALMIRLAWKGQHPDRRSKAKVV